MFENLIIGQFNSVVKNTIAKFSKKYNAESQLFLREVNNRILIDVLANYKPQETITIKELDIPVVSPETVSEKIIGAIEKLQTANNITDAKIMLLLKDDNVKACLYSNTTFIKVIELKQLL